MAFHPDYENNGFFYVNYTDNLGDTVIARYTVSGDPNLADLSSALVLLNISQPFGNHNGGQLQFGPDGYLYIGMGDGGSGGDPGNRAQDLNDLLGKMLRINVDGDRALRDPCDQSVCGRIPRQETKSGHWACAIHGVSASIGSRATCLSGMLDRAVGKRSISRRLPVQVSENYGWRLMEGSSCFNPPNNCNDGTLILPVAEYDHALGNCSITGGYGYRGSQVPRTCRDLFLRRLLFREDLGFHYRGKRASGHVAFNYQLR